MSKPNAYLHLLIRMTIVLLFVVSVAFINRTDANVKAEDELQDQELQELTDEEIIANMEGYASEDDFGVPETDYTDIDPVLVADNPNDDTPPTGSPITVKQDEDPDVTEPGADIAGENGDETSEDDAAANVLTEEELARLQAEGLARQQAEELARYKETPEYIESLLVTSPDHYDEAVVASARSIPLDSDNDRYMFITGRKKKIYKVGNMPEGFRSDEETAKKMVTIDVPVWKINSKGEKYSTYWPLTIHANLADSCRCIFSDIYLLDIQFPFNYLRGYTYRKVGGVGLVSSKLMSTHAFGVALDINMGDYDNDYFLGKGNDLRNKKNPYCIPDEVIAIFEDYGWFWGGNYDICADTMHFQYFELGFLQYDSDEPFPILYRGAEGMDNTVIKNLSQRLVRLGYLANETSNFSKKLDKAVKKFQEDNGLEPDGIVDYETWEPLINKTHFMRYVF